MRDKMLKVLQDGWGLLSRHLLWPTLVLTIFTVVAVNVLNIPNPPIICVLVVVFFTFIGGFYYGSISGLITMAYCFYFFSQPGKLFCYTNMDLYKVFVIFIATAAMIFMVGRLKKQVDSRTWELEQMNEKLRLMATVDGLTGVMNRRCFDEMLDREWKRSLREKVPVAIVMVDVDYFKKYNDTYGHQSGDECLRQVAEAMEKRVHRPSDYAARYGGEEFVLLLSNTSLDGAIKVAEDIRLLIENLKLPHAASEVSSYVTISLGVMTLIPDAGMQISEVVRKADQALYYAKRRGRNRVMSYSDDMEKQI